MPKITRHPERGMALIFAMLSIMVIMSALAVIMIRTKASQNETIAGVDNVILDEAARAGIDLAIERIYNTYRNGLGNTTDNWGSFRSYLNNEMQIPNTEDLNGNGTRDGDEKNDNGRNDFEGWPEEYEELGFPLFESPQDIEDPATGEVVATVNQVYVVRNDDRFGANITLTSVVQRDGRTKSAVQQLRIGGVDQRPARFAILANNISCILCHANILSLPLEYGLDDPGTHDRVKVASLQSMLVRNNASEPDSYLSGTLYTRGKVYKENGSLYSTNELASNPTLRAWQFDPTNGLIKQNGSGYKNMNAVPFSNASTDSEGMPLPFSNLYRDYGTDAESQTDGPVPTDFPAPYPDEDGDRYVDDAEFDDARNSVDGSISFTLDPSEVTGTVKAGVAYGVPQGGVYTGTNLPTSSTADATSSLENNGYYDGNLILVGSKDDPIRIDKTVAVNGDLVIKGPVKGRGQIFARGNVYIVGDVTYANDSNSPSDYGSFTESGVKKENLFGIVAGGSILMGDYLTVRGVNSTTTTNDKFPNSAGSIHFRKQNNTVSMNSQTLKNGYFDPYSVDPNGTRSDASHGHQMSFTQSELKLFNRLELERAKSDPTYKPRLYGLRESQPDKIYVYNGNDEHAVKYNESTVLSLTSYLTAKGMSQNYKTTSAFHYMNPKGNWMSEDTLRRIWWDDEQARANLGDKDDNSRFRFDGLLYSNNAIFTQVRSMGRHKSNTYGRMEIRGGLIAPDLGVFVPGDSKGDGLKLLYDNRVEDFITAVDTNEVQVQRGAFYYVASNN